MPDSGALLLGRRRAAAPRRRAMSAFTLITFLLCMAVFGVAALAGILLTGEVYAFVILACMPALALCFRTARENSARYAAVMFAIGGRELVAATNSFWFTTFGGGLDAAAFHRTAAAIAGGENVEFRLGSRFYAHFLGAIYEKLEPSVFLGAQTSIIAFLLASLLFFKVSDAIWPHTKNIGGYVLLAAMPASLLYGSYTMREPWQQLFFVATMYCSLRFVAESRLRWLFVAVGAGALLSVWHSALLLAAGGIITAAIWLRYFVRARRRGWVVTAAWIAVLAFVAVLAVFLLVRFNGTFASFLSSWRVDGAEARANYGRDYDFSSPPLFVISVIREVALYMLAPLPWQVSSPMDVYASAENVLRLLLFFALFRAWRDCTGVQRKVFFLAFWGVAFTEAVWSLGTINWGTAIRHHLVVLPVLLAVGWPVLLSTVAVPPERRRRSPVVTLPRTRVAVRRV